ncbi:TIGR03557 family F420-dependent LLM class oxidoreductase [Streptomyces albus subsp. chlorinus]|uniref:TIGR03557 family F420-dependent LLM class oxidoreductase n=1 Tax=Streptomyces albus TaxID=1888 RepID=UPI00156F7D30|nr:TIGR03557 family F420-dependent LLM class oxidoreductase [Streptomyces albus]NSC20699.1 TIGR03557 family F420-dependent LLM class oxidoreductase [Streptomyces albus subsp. chlorinus]
MVSIGYFLACEEFGPKELVRQARMAEEAGFQRLWISDHFHPWTDAQGSSPFVWSVIGALSQVTSLPVGTAVTCPTFRMHPAIVAHAAATAAVQLEGRFTLGVGSGEALNEHVLGQHWPPPGERLERLEEAVHLIRRLHTGKRTTFRGAYYRVDEARLYTVPEEPVPISVSAFGPKATKVAARIGDAFCTASPNAELVSRYREAGGGRRPVQGGMKVCWAPSEEEGLDTAHRLWATELLPGRLPSTLTRQKDFAAAASLVPRDDVAAQMVCGPDAERYRARLREYADAGFDEVYVQQIGSRHEEFFRVWQDDILPAFHGG